MQLRDLLCNILFHLAIHLRIKRKNNWREDWVQNKILFCALIRFCRKICLRHGEFTRIRLDDINHHYCFRCANFISAHDSFVASIAQKRAKARTTWIATIIFHLGIWFRCRIYSREMVLGRRYFIVRLKHTSNHNSDKYKNC